MWKEYLSQAEGPDVWTALRFTNPRKAQMTPELRTVHNGTESVCTNFESKVRAFQILFPEPPPAPPTTRTRSRPEIPWQTFSQAEVERAIFTSSSKKAPGPDAITFACIQAAYKAIPLHFDHLYAALGQEGYHPRCWRQATTVVIPKPNKPDYRDPKAYRPIALLNSLGKILEKLMATRISTMAEAHHLLHLDQIGGRPQRSAIDAALAFAHDIEMGKSTKLITSALFLDVCGAFNNISATRLLHTMQQLGCPRPVRTWCSAFLSERTIALSFDGQTDRQRPISTGIHQGSPASPILFLLYLRPLFDTLNTIHPNIWTPSYIDDVALVAQGKTREGNARALEAAARTAFQWARDNAVALDDAKSEMLDFQPSQTRHHHRRNQNMATPRNSGRTRHKRRKERCGKMDRHFL
jgi:hypothetical protein